MGIVLLLGAIVGGIIAIVAVVAFIASRTLVVPSDKAAIIQGRPSVISVRGPDPVSGEDLSVITGKTGDT